MSSIQFFNNLIIDSYSDDYISNIFIVFSSINNLLILIYSNVNKSIISFDIINDKKINDIKNSHEQFITSFRHYLDLINKKDLILSISSNDNNLKIWDFNNFECLVDIKNINNNGFLNSACLLKDNNQNLILTSNYSFIYSEPIKVFDFQGNKIKEINNSNDSTSFIDIYYDTNSNKNFIIACTNYYSKSYDYNKNEIFHIYCDDICPTNIIVNNKGGIVELIESSFDGNIRIWNFHSGFLLNRIEISKETLREICLWDNNYLFVACDDKSIKLIDYNNGTIIRELKGHNNYIVSIKKIFHPQYGKCLLSQGLKKDNIKLWVFEN